MYVCEGHELARCADSAHQGSAMSQDAVLTRHRSYAALQQRRHELAGGADSAQSQGKNKIYIYF